MNRMWDRDCDIERGDLPITNEEDTEMSILCKCGHLICGNVLCPFCGRKYITCDICGLLVCEDDTIDSICEECLNIDCE